MFNEQREVQDDARNVLEFTIYLKFCAFTQLDGNNAVSVDVSFIYRTPLILRFKYVTKDAANIVLYLYRCLVRHKGCINSLLKLLPYDIDAAI